MKNKKLLLWTITIFIATALPVNSKVFSFYCLSDVTNNIKAVKEEKKEEERENNLNHDERWRKFRKLREQYPLVPDLYSGSCSYMERKWGYCSITKEIYYNSSLDKIFISGYQAMMFGSVFKTSEKVFYEVSEKNVRKIPQFRNTFIINTPNTFKGILVRRIGAYEFLFYDGKEIIEFTNRNSSYPIINKLFNFLFKPTASVSKSLPIPSWLSNLKSTKNKRLFSVNTEEKSLITEIKPNLQPQQIQIRASKINNISHLYGFPGYLPILAVSDYPNSILIETANGLKTVIKVSGDYRISNLWQSEKDYAIYFALTNDSISEIESYYSITPPMSFTKRDCIANLNIDKPISLP